MLLVWGWLLICASVSVSADTVVLKSGENLTIKCSTADCLTGLRKIDGRYSGMHLCRDHDPVAYYDYDPDNPNLGQFGAITNDDAPRILKTGFFEEHNITITNVTVHDSGFYRCVFSYSIADKFKSNTSCNMYRVDIDRGTDPEVSTPFPMPESRQPAIPFLVIIITAAVSIVITMIFTLCCIPKIKQWSPSRESADAQAHSSDYVYEVMTRNGFRAVT